MTDTPILAVSSAPASNINRLPRVDLLVTTLDIASKQDVTPGNIGSLIVEGGAVIYKGLKLGRPTYRVPGTIGYVDGHFIGCREDCVLTEFACKPQTGELDLTMTSVGAAPVQIKIVTAQYKSADEIVDIWARVNSQFYSRGTISLPFAVQLRAPITGTINYVQGDGSSPSPLNFTKPLLHNPTNNTMNFFLEPEGDPVFIYDFHIQVVAQPGEAIVQCGEPGGTASTVVQAKCCATGTLTASSRSSCSSCGQARGTGLANCRNNGLSTDNSGSRC